MTSKIDAAREAAAKAICHSRKFETGQGGCAAICMEALGSSRPNCRHAGRVHSQLANAAIDAYLAALGDEMPEPVGPTYYSEGKDAEYFENLPDKEFAWALTCASQDLNDSNENVSAWMPVTALLSSAADRISNSASAILALQQRVRELEDGLAPFASVAEKDIGDDEQDHDTFRPMLKYNRAPRLTVGNLRRARTLTTEKGE